MLFFFQAEDGIRDYKVTGVQTCALPISARRRPGYRGARPVVSRRFAGGGLRQARRSPQRLCAAHGWRPQGKARREIGRAAGRGRGEISVGGGSFKKKKIVNVEQPARFVA